VNDAELVAWLQRGVVIALSLSDHATQYEVLGRYVEWGDLQGTYAPCHAPSVQQCLFCPWEMCYRSS
jgi:hypothetical protein